MCVEDLSEARHSGLEDWAVVLQCGCVVSKNTCNECQEQKPSLNG